MNSINDFNIVEFLKDYCHRSLRKIAQQSINDNLITSIQVRYVDHNGKFGYTTVGSFFFISDSMYLISDNAKYKDERDNVLFQA